MATPFLRRKGVPVHQNLVMPDEQSARSIARGDLEMYFCPACGFIFNAAFDLSKLCYDENYDNAQTYSDVFRDHVDNLARRLIEENDVRNCRIVEVGCGQGQFLHKLVASEQSGNIGYGFDPAYTGPDESLSGRLKFYKSYYGPKCADLAADIVVCRHVIEHVPDPVALLHTVRQALANSPHARVFFETPSVEWILRNSVIWDFFYEHCSYWTEASLTTAFEIAGFRIEKVETVFGGQYLWLEATPKLDDNSTNVRRSAGAIPSLAQLLARRESQVLAGWDAQINKLRQKGPIALWGAGAKGVTLANLLDGDRKLFTCVVDLNPHKQGAYIAGSGHPIVAPEALGELEVKTAILMNPNYRQENLNLLNSLCLDVDLVELNGDSSRMENTMGISV